MAFPRSAPGATRRVNRSQRCFVPATPAPTTPRTTSSCWTRRSLACQASTGWATSRATIRAWSAAILARADSAGASHDFVRGLVEANIEYSIGHQVSAKVREALLLFQEEDWVQAIEADGTVREGAFLAELTPLIDLSAWGEGARLIMRRERPHPGAQLSLFDFSEGYRHTCFITNAPDNDADAAVLELRHRGHARVEDRIRNWKDCGLKNLPFASFTQNLTWVAASLIAGSLLAWAQMTCLDRALKKAEPKTLRYRILHVAAVLVRHGRRLVLRLDETWPWAPALQRAFLKLRSTFP